MKTRWYKNLAAVACAALSFNASAAEISHVSVRQRWPWSRLVDIDYVITDATQAVDIAVTAYNGSTPLVLNSGLSGDLYSVSGQGARRITWDPTQSQYADNEVLARFHVTLTPTPVPLYMIVDLTKNAGADGQIEYIYPDDTRLETYGRYTNVWFGVTNDSVYATDKLVLRRISAGTFKMGGALPPTLSTELTKEFYAGVFEVTQRQWELITGGKPSYYNNTACYATRPVEQVKYNDIRGLTSDSPSVDWPTTDRTVVSADSFLGLLRAQTGFTDFDLPTEAQWEYLCRAGTTTVFNDGNAAADVNGDNANTNTWLNALGRYRFNGGFTAGGETKPGQGVGVTEGSASVGSYQANAWGMYDTHGNVWEWCLDWSGSLSGGTDPVGPVSAASRVARGGSSGSVASYCTSASRISYTPDTKSLNIGFRVVRTLP